MDKALVDNQPKPELRIITETDNNSTEPTSNITTGNGYDTKKVLQLSEKQQTNDTDKLHDIRQTVTNIAEQNILEHSDSPTPLTVKPNPSDSLFNQASKLEFPHSNSEPPLALGKPAEMKLPDKIRKAVSALFGKH